MSNDDELERLRRERALREADEAQLGGLAGELLSLAVEDGTVKRLDEAIAGLSVEDLRLRRKFRHARLAPRLPSLWERITSPQRSCLFLDPLIDSACGLSCVGKLRLALQHAAHDPRHQYRWVRRAWLPE